MRERMEAVVRAGPHGVSDRKGCPDWRRASVAITRAMLLAAKFAERRRLGIVDTVLHGLQGPQVGEHGLEIVVGKIFVDADGHDGA
jgi:hypothetical protein